MKVSLAYGQGYLPVELPDGRTTVIQPSHNLGLADERGAVLAALEKPIAARPLREWLKPGGRVCIVFTDITRPTPNDRLIPWLLGCLADVPREDITLLNSLGTHRPNTRAELEQLLTPSVVQNYRVLNHESENPDALIPLGVTHDGTPALLNRHFVEADVRIVTGFIEPHFFAGFSGGPKGIMPGIAGLRTVMSNHGVNPINDPNATFGVTQGNPIWEEMRDIALRAGPSFLLNVTLNEQRQITGVFAGDLVTAHRAGCDFVRQSAMQPCDAPFDIVVTTNSGYPLDQNLYQTVKGMSAAAQIVTPGGFILAAARCNDGFPEHGNFRPLLFDHATPQALLDAILRPGFLMRDQWEAQLLALIVLKARVGLVSELSPSDVRRAHLEPVTDITRRLQEELDRLGGDAPIAVLPEGPMTIPYLA